METVVYQFVMTVVAPGEHRHEILEALHWALGIIRSHSGHLAGTVCTQSPDASRIYLVTEWQSKATRVRFMRSDLFARILSVADLSGNPPVFRTASVETHDLTFVADLRDSGHNK